ncbi:MAG: nucleotidyl transferase AbiEii/AbiGii toxin family protein [Planctomycetes bacterium]|nr:nucleotidyl transferase AbiEii/AbiGii toxin family protein [Planctomycetota bacterium]
MNTEPRTKDDYGDRATEAAHRVLVDLGQVLGTYFLDGIVVVGGMVPDLLVKDPGERHIPSLDVDLALDPDKLTDGKYAEMVKALLDTKRYALTEHAFKLRTVVDLGDGGPPIPVDVDFLKPPGRWPRDASKTVPGFRPLDAEACRAAFLAPQTVDVKGLNTTGAENTVHVSVTSLEGFFILKAYALGGRDKPKDAYDLCYCIEESPDAAGAVARAWRSKMGDPLVAESLRILREKFETVRSFGPQQVVLFHNSPSAEERERQAQSAFQFMRRFLEIVDGA